MTALVNAKMWQRNRALELHRAFQSVATRMRLEGISLTEGLVEASTHLNGKLIKAAIRGDKINFKPLRCSADSLYRIWRQWNDGGCVSDSLLLNYRYVAPRTGRNRPLPEALAAEIQRLATMKTGGRDKSQLTPLSVIYQQLRDRFAARQAIPGINYDDYPDGAEFPWSYKTITRYAPADHERALGNRGIAAFRQKACHVTMDYSKLRKCELFVLDDVRLDLLCVDDATGKAIEVKCYLMMEVASRAIVAFFLKPNKAITQENVMELVAHGLRVPGFGIGVGYTTYIKFERGTVACSDDAKHAIETLTEDRVNIIRTSMDGGISWVGAARDRASGHAAGKAVIESFMRRLHHALMHLPGQIGNNRSNTPASVGYGSKQLGSDKKAAPGTFIAECERLAAFEKEVFKKTGRRITLQFPGLRLSKLTAAVHEAIDKHNHEPGHNYQGHGEFIQEEVQPGVWQDVEESPAQPSGTAVDVTPMLQIEAGKLKRTYVLKDSGAPPPPTLTPKQRGGMYWRLWNAAKVVRPNSDRFAITRRVLGCVPKIVDMTDEQFLKVTHVFESMAKEGAAQ